MCRIEGIIPLILQMALIQTLMEGAMGFQRGLAGKVEGKHPPPGTAAEGCVIEKLVEEHHVPWMRFDGVGRNLLPSEAKGIPGWIFPMLVQDFQLCPQWFPMGARYHTQTARMPPNGIEIKRDFDDVACRDTCAHI